jgi:shikimate kinase
MDKLLYMLIGPKGAGKTYIGALVERHTSIRFISVERI